MLGLDQITIPSLKLNILLPTAKPERRVTRGIDSRRHPTLFNIESQCVFFFFLLTYMFLYQGNRLLSYLLQIHFPVFSLHFYLSESRGNYFPLKKNIFLRFTYVFERERESTSGKERESQANSTLSTEPDVGLDLTTLTQWPELKPRVWSSTDHATQALFHFYITKCAKYLKMFFLRLEGSHI